MEKYGVVIDDTKVKEASERKLPSCSKCGATLVAAHPGDVPYWCPNCGTEPFEKKP